MPISTVFFWSLGYLSGSLPFGLWVTRLVKGIDIRDGGSGHITTTNTIRQAGWLPGAVVLILDIAKGFLPVYHALHANYFLHARLYDWEVAVTAGLVVAGHCWPVFAQFRGGMGLAAMGGCLLAIHPLAFLLAVGTLIFFVLVLHHGARGSVVTGLVVPLVLWAAGLRGTELWVAVAAGLVVAVRFTIDWNRKYRELWLDREQ